MHRHLISRSGIREVVGLALTAWLVLVAGSSTAGAAAVIVSPDVAHKAWTQGSVPVLVQLALPFVAEGHLPGDAAVAAQRQAIASAQASVLSALAGLSHRVRRQYQFVPGLALEVGPDALTRLESLPGLVARVDEDRLAAPDLAQSGPLVEADQAWAAGFDGTGKMVAILDTGVDKTHGFFSGRVVEEACYALGQDGVAGAGDCPNGLSSQTGAGAGVPCTYAVSGCTHGTHVAGIAAGRAYSGATFSGVARGASVMAVQVFSRFTGSPCSGGEDPCALSYTSDQIAGMDRVYALRSTHSFASVNMSLGGGQYFNEAACDAANALEKTAIDNLRSVGIATVISSGNSGFSDSLSAPGCISTAISVGSTTKTDQVSSFSNTASFLKLLAPGSSITSSVPGGVFGIKSGTSMAAPHVTGAWAILKQASGSATVAEVLTALRSTGLSVTDPLSGLAFPRIRIRQAINALPSPCTPAGGSFVDGDYDGDGKADIGVYRGTTGEWFIRCSSSATLLRVAWGAPVLNDKPVVGDFDGDGRADIAVYRQTTGQWFIRRSSDLTLAAFGWGVPGLRDMVAPGDYDGDNKTDLAVYRFVTGEWFIFRSSDSTVMYVPWGSPFGNDIPVPGDYDGDGRTDVAIYRGTTGQWFIRRSSDATLASFGWGVPGLLDVPVPGDFDGDGKTDLAVYRLATGEWFIFRSSDMTILYFAWGSPFLGDTPVREDYDGDGKVDVAVYRTSNGQWFIRRSSDGALVNVGWGSPALQDVPVMNP